MAAGFGFINRLVSSRNNRIVSKFSALRNGTRISRITRTKSSLTSTFPTILLSAQSRTVSVAGQTSLLEGRNDSALSSRQATLRTKSGFGVPVLDTLRQGGSLGTQLRPVSQNRSVTELEGAISSFSLRQISENLKKSISPILANSLASSISKKSELKKKKSFDPSVVETHGFQDYLTPTELALERGSPAEPPEELEFQSGPQRLYLKNEDKPKILGVIEEDYKSSGNPGTLVIIFSKLKNSKYKVNSYKLRKKSIFEDEDYNKGFEIQEKLPPPRFEKYLENLGVKREDVLVYIDRDVLPGRVYSYRLFVEYQGNGSATVRERGFDTNRISSIGLSSFSNIGLDELNRA